MEGSTYHQLVEEGSVLAGRYRVGETLGRGGMGIVFAATHIQLGTPVAVKMLRKDALEEPELVERFLREARSAARLRGEHVCRVTDFGTTDDGLPFMVMEFLDGEDLKSIVDHTGKMDPVQVATFIAQACIGVAEAHQLGIVHRDLKPGNLFLTRLPDGRRIIKLLDFGIAKATTTMEKNLTATTKAMGSPAYMSPEQLRSSSTVDPRSDVWSLGITMFELLTESLPFTGDTPYELALSIANDEPVTLPDTLPPEIVKVVHGCMTKDPTKRYQDVAELAAALAPIARNGRDVAAAAKAALAPPPSTTTGARDRSNTTPSPQTETTMRGASGAIDPTPRSRSRLAIPLAIAGVIALGAGGYVWWSSRDADPAAAAHVTAPPPAAPPAAPVAIDASPVAIDASELEPDAPPAAEPTTKPVDPKLKKPLRKPRVNPTDPKDPVDLGKSRY